MLDDAVARDASLGGREEAIAREFLNVLQRAACAAEQVG
jgi:hypothetical protein